MDDNMLDFLDGQAPAEPTPAAQQPEAPAPEPVQAQDAAPPSDGPVRDDKGRFAAKAQTEAAPAPVDAPQAPAPQPEAAKPADKAPDGYVPVGVVQALREELNAFKRQQQQAPPQPAPDIYEDPDAYQQYAHQQVVAERVRWSRELAEARHGAETVAEAQQWAERQFAADPVFAQRALSSQDPYGFAMAEYQQHQALQMLADPTLRERFQAFLQGSAQPAQAATPVVAPQPPTAPPPSITQAPSAGGAQHIPTGPGEAYRAIFT